MESSSKAVGESKGFSNASEADAFESKTVGKDKDQAVEEIDLNQTNQKERKPTKNLETIEKGCEEQIGDENESQKKTNMMEKEAEGNDFLLSFP